MKKNKYIKYESLTIKQAQHKNFGLDAHMNTVAKILDQEKTRRAAEIDLARRQIAKSLKSIRHVFPVHCRLLDRVHVERKKDIKKVAVHVVQSYMQRQAKNKERWRAMIAENPDAMDTSRPLSTPEHLQFIEKAFPEIYDVSEDNNWSYEYNQSADIYEHGRAAHDMKCLSTRSKPVGVSTGAYPQRQPINVRFWQPEIGSEENVESVVRCRGATRRK